MSQISLKSISGITSITTPAGVDNQFTLHTNNTSQALKLDSAGNIHIHNHVNTTGVSTASNFKTGTSNLHSAGLNAAYVDVDDFVDVGSNIQLGNAGVVTATSFSGSGANLTNLDASDLASGTVPTARLGSGTASSSTFLAGDSTFKTVSGTTINNNANNRVITGSGTANTLEGEVNLTWDGSSFKATGSGGVTLRAGSTNAGAAALYLDGDSDGDWSGATFAHITHDTSGHLNIMSRNPAGNANIIFGTNDYNAFRVDENRHVRPESDNARDLGTSSYRWRNIYTADLHLSNKGHTNDVDGTWGQYTIQEGQDDLFLINKRSGKKYKFNLTEVS